LNQYLLAAVLGVVEGVTEFLPVSSTAHLRLAQSFLGVSLQDEFWKLFAVFIQLGAILSVLVYYRGKITRLCFDFPRFCKTRDTSHPIFLITVAFLFTAVPAFVLKKVIGANLESLYIISGSLLVGGIVMIAVDYFFQDGRIQEVEQMKPFHAAVIGILQLLSAVFPGTSRSMSTIAAGQIVGLSRTAALEFSFLLAIPIMIVATLYDLLKYVKDESNGAISQEQIVVLGIGFLVSFVVAYGVIAWFLAYVRNRGFLPFGIYRIAIGAALLFALSNGWIQ
jgi:undecaprenyl-diphosphatase